MSIPDQLRTAAIAAAKEALGDGKVDFAHKILAFLAGDAPDNAAAPVAPVGDAHSYHYWMDIILNRFIPALRKAGKSCFTTHELFHWVLQQPDLALTAGDLEQLARKGHIRWRHRIGDALEKLKTQGVIANKPGSCTYTIKGSTPASSFGALPLFNG